MGCRLICQPHFHIDMYCLCILITPHGDLVYLSNKTNVPHEFMQTILQLNITWWLSMILFLQDSFMRAWLCKCNCVWGRSRFHVVYCLLNQSKSLFLSQTKLQITLNSIVLFYYLWKCVYVLQAFFVLIITWQKCAIIVFKSWLLICPQHFFGINSSLIFIVLFPFQLFPGRDKDKTYLVVRD